MSCDVIEKLRLEARELRQELREKRELARQKGGSGRLAHRPHSDFETYLQRRIARNAAEIARHVAEHRCE